MAQIPPRIVEGTCFSIGDTSIAIENVPPEQTINVPAAYRPFITAAAADIRIILKLGQTTLTGMDKIFESPPIWTLYRGQGQKVYSIFSQLRQRAHSVHLFDDKPHAEIQFSPEFTRPLDPFCGPALELLTVERLAGGSGCLLHGCGIRVSDKGILFAGRSGAGKSTMLRLWAEEKDALILSDDRAIAQLSDTQLRIYGTPWHGKVQAGLPDGAKLSGIFFLKHGFTNRVRELSTDRVVRNLLTCSFPPLWDARGMAATLEFFDAIGHRIPCYELEFIPDISVVDYIRQWIIKH